MRVTYVRNDMHIASFAIYSWLHHNLQAKHRHTDTQTYKFIQIDFVRARTCLDSMQCVSVAKSLELSPRQCTNWKLNEARLKFTEKYKLELKTTQQNPLLYTLFRRRLSAYNPRDCRDSSRMRVYRTFKCCCSLCRTDFFFPFHMCTVLKCFSLASNRPHTFHTCLSYAD